LIIQKFSAVRAGEEVARLTSAGRNMYPREDLTEEMEDEGVILFSGGISNYGLLYTLNTGNIYLQVMENPAHHP